MKKEEEEEELFSWVTAVLANRVFIRIWVAKENG